MEPELWQAIQILFDRVERSFAPLAGAPTASGDTETSDLNQSLVQARAGIRQAFDELRVTLLGTLSEQESYQVLFPLVVTVDEQVQTRYFTEQQISWPLLQKELYEVDDGGELFYDTLDAILRKPQTPQFIYEVHYFCLKHGFQGKYVGDAAQINKYMGKLEEKIPLSPMESAAIMAQDPGEISYPSSPVWAYGSAALILILVYAVMRHAV